MPTEIKTLKAKLLEAEGLLSDCAAMLDGEEESVREEHADLIERVEAYVDAGDVPDAPSHVRKFLDLSTAHLTPETARHLRDIHADIDRLPFAGGITGHGWLAFCHDENLGEGDDRIPDDLFSLMEYGRSVGAEYLLLDCDAEPIDGLPTYEW